MAEPPTPLSNQDFRRMLATPRRVEAGGAPAATLGFGSSDGFAKPAPKKVLTEADKKKREKSKAWKEIVSQREQDKKEHDSVYRDRAKERRENKNADAAADADVADAQLVRVAGKGPRATPRRDQMGSC